MLGSFVAGYMVGTINFNSALTYGWALVLESFMLFMSMVTLHRGWVVGEWCAAFACGLQNALATSYSGAIVRTTHMTGICTDIGNILGQACRLDSKAELWRLKVHVPILVGFMVGGLLGQVSYGSLHMQSMWVPCILTGGIGVAYLSTPFIQKAAKLIEVGEFGVRGWTSAEGEVLYWRDEGRRICLLNLGRCSMRKGVISS